ncbi:lactonase family protein [Halorubrum sp. BOL3-1]|uniref:lactonase family protein n=1 Tax=Halorubrum sp. BOL3-1 TaxID=2497325 RepID=UPI001004F756|nr:lactonase family protein [Halorubrum sp. BOL3-1]QAU14014.1 lactonase family protein [Halorubrum sp. BOL3-1]
MVDESGRDLAVVGSYTETEDTGLTSYRIDGESLDRCDAAEERDPSFLDVHPSEPILVAVNEREEGSAVSYWIDLASGRLSRLNRTATGDAGPCHVTIGPCGEYVVVAHYAGGSTALMSLGTDGALDGPLDLRRHEGSGPRGDRQASPHPHSAQFVTDSIVYVPDLGADRVAVYELDRDDDRLCPLPDAAIGCRPGAGPRHFAVHPTAPIGYLVNELNATLSVVDFADPQRPTVVDTLSTLPDGVEATDTIAADVHVHPSGEYLFASNRGHDSLAMFRIRTSPEKVVREAVTPTGGRWPRNFAIHPDGERIFVCHQHSNDVIQCAFNVGTGELRRKEVRTKIVAPTCLQFI